MGRNLVKLKEMMMSSLIRNYDVIIVILMSQQLRKGESLHGFFVFGWIKLQFGVRASDFKS